jgi:hypothetical protein
MENRFSPDEVRRLREWMSGNLAHDPWPLSDDMIVEVAESGRGGVAVTFESGRTFRLRMVFESVRAGRT